MITIMASHSSLSQSKLATYNRQKCINLLEKITKNMFRMFRDETTTKEEICERFFFLKEQLDSLGDITLNADYHREMKIYIELLSGILSGTSDLNSIRSGEMTKLNRIQKTKNKSGYKRKKSIKKY